MRRSISLLAGIAALASAAPSSAAIIMLAQGVLNGSSDKSGLTGTMENGLRADVLGGLGSGLAWAGGTTFLATPDRGPNATPYNSLVDDTTSYISRFQTLDLNLVASGSGLPFTLNPTLSATTLLYSPTALTYGTGAGLGNKIDGTTPIGSGALAENTANKFYFSGRSDNFGAGNSLNALNARFDPEAIRVSNDGKSVFVSDEYGPYVRAFDRATGALVKTYALPANLAVSTLSAQGAVEISANTSGRVANKGMEGLAITPDGTTLVGIMQAPLAQDASVAATKNMLRIVTIDIATGATKEYGYNLTTGSGASEIVAISATKFLVDERDGKGLGDGSVAKVKQFFTIDIAGATDITNLNGAAAAAAVVPKGATPFLDLVAALATQGVTGANVPAKIEGLAFGQDVVSGGLTYHTLFVANDNDFLPGTAGPNQFYVFGFTDSDLPGYTPQRLAAAVPEPATWAMMIAGFGLVGLARRRKVVPALV